MFRTLLSEQLESRCVLTSMSALAAPWPEAHDLTISFAPDGTAIGDHSSLLFQTLNASAAPADWQREILRAFQTWAVEANINIGVVADGGQTFGSLGLKQGDARFGDIRIGTLPLGNDVVAAADPYDPFVADTWVGDVLLNATETFGTAQSGAEYDLFAIMLHEAGHVFGLSHSADLASPMFETIQPAAATQLTATDVGLLRSEFGARPADSFEGSGGNDSAATATELSWVPQADGSRHAIARGDLQTTQDVDVYRIAIPQGAGIPTIHLATSGISLLTARMSLLDASGNVVAVAQADDPLHNDLDFSGLSLIPGGTYFVKIEASHGDVFGIGTYELSITDAGNVSIPVASAMTVEPSFVATTPNQAATIIANSSTLTTTPGYVENTYFEVDGSLDPQRTTQAYRVRSADIDPTIRNVLTVLVATTSQVSGQLRVRVLDDTGHVVSTDVLYAADGKLEIQAGSVVSNRDYFVELTIDGSSTSEIDFELTVDFDQDGSHLRSYVDGRFVDSQNSLVESLFVNRGQQFHFVLSASDMDQPADDGVAMTISDAGGRVVVSMIAHDGQFRSRDVYLTRGVYTARFVRLDPTNAAPSFFQLAGLTLSEPIGPQLRDTTLQPVEASADAALNGLAYYWLPATLAPVNANVGPNFAMLGLNAATNPIAASGTAPYYVSSETRIGLMTQTGFATSTSSPSNTLSGSSWLSNYLRRTGTGKPSNQASSNPQKPVADPVADSVAETSSADVTPVAGTVVEPETVPVPQAGDRQIVPVDEVRRQEAPPPSTTNGTPATTPSGDDETSPPQAGTDSEKAASETKVPAENESSSVLKTIANALFGLMAVAFSLGGVAHEDQPAPTQLQRRRKRCGTTSRAD